MIASFEGRAFSNGAHTSAHKYQNLQNLPHWHIEHELVFVVSGCAEITVNHSVYSLPVNTAAFIPSEAVHHIKSMENSIMCVIKVDAEHVQSIVGTQRLVSPILKYDYELLSKYREIKDELQRAEHLGDIIADHLCAILIAQIFRGEILDPTPSDNGSKRQRHLLMHITQHYSDITFQKAAVMMGFSPTYFSEYFHQSFGLTFTEYLNIIRVSAAVDRIAAKKQSITEIALECGFGTIRSFNRVFKQLTGYAPTRLPPDYVFLHRTKPDLSYAERIPTLSCTVVLE